MNDLHITAAPSPDGMTRILTLTQADLTAKKSHRKIVDLASFTAYLKRWGDPAIGTIYWTDKRVIALLDEREIQSGRGDQDTVALTFQRPIVAQRWFSAIGNVMSHKDFKDFLELRYNEVTDGTQFFTKIANLSLAQTFNYDAKLDTDQTYSVAFKSDAGPEVAKLPKHVEVVIPLIEGLETAFTLRLRLKFKAPTSADESPTFQLLWDDQADVEQEAARCAVQDIEGSLPGWLVVQGAPNLRAQAASCSPDY